MKYAINAVNISRLDLFIGDLAFNTCEVYNYLFIHLCLVHLQVVKFLSTPASSFQFADFWFRTSTILYNDRKNLYFN